MGLAVSTHVLADMLANDAEGAEAIAENIACVNELLAEEKLPAHVEPTEIRTRMRAHTGSFPYSFLHYLRRAFAYVHEEMILTPVADGEDPSEDEAIEEASTLFDTHLLCHSDAEGYYVPVDFEDVIFDPDDRGLPGGSLGSTQRLMAELVEAAPELGITLEHGRLSDAEVTAINADGGSGPYWRERLVWLTMFEAARVSLADKTMIVFT